MFTRLLWRSTARGYASVDYLLSSVPKLTPPPPPIAKGGAKSKKKLNLSHYLYSAQDLNKHFRVAEYSTPSRSLINRANTFFFKSSFAHEWTSALFSEIPDVKVERLASERQHQLDSMEPYNRTHYHETLSASRSSFGVKALLLKPLPEVLLLGHTNTGKSTLVNSLFVNNTQAKSSRAVTEYAYVLGRPGFTKCLNCFNVGNALRIVDSPGYGEFGEAGQGKVVLDYIKERKQLRRVFVLIDSVEGIREEDATLIEFLIQNGAAFEIVFTKVDAVVQKQFARIGLKPVKGSVEPHELDLIKEGNSRVVEHYQNMIAESGLGDLATLPRIFFNNSMTNNFVLRRYGFQELRYVIMESCGLIEAPAPEASDVTGGPEASNVTGGRKKASRRPTTSR